MARSLKTKLELRAITNSHLIRDGPVMMSAAANKGNQARYSITSSASNCIEFGTSMPRTIAVFMLMTSSKCSVA